MVSEVHLDEMAKTVDAVIKDREVTQVETVKTVSKGREVLPVPLVIVVVQEEPDNAVLEVNKVVVDHEDQRDRKAQEVHPDHLIRQKRDQKAHVVSQVQLAETDKTVVTVMMDKRVPKVNEVQTVQPVNPDKMVAMESTLFVLTARRAPTDHPVDLVKTEDLDSTDNLAGMATQAEKDHLVSMVYPDQLVNVESQASQVIAESAEKTVKTVNQVPMVYPELKDHRVPPVETVKRGHEVIKVMLVVTASPVPRVQKVPQVQTALMVRMALAVRQAAVVIAVTQVEMAKTANQVSMDNVVNAVFKVALVSAVTLVLQVYQESSTSWNSAPWSSKPCAKSMTSALVTTTMGTQIATGATSLTKCSKLTFEPVSPSA